MELTGVVQNIIYRNASNGYTVLSVMPDQGKMPITAVGKMPLLDVGDSVSLDGAYTFNARFGQQFAVNSYSRVAPSTESSIIAYLSSGAVRGVGPSLAKAIVAQFGLDTLQVLEHTPDAILEVPGIGVKKAAMILGSYRENTQMRNVLLALEPYGVTVNQANRMVQIYGDLCLAKIQENPYQLIDDIDGIGFLTADRIAQNVAGFETDSLARLQAGIRYALERAKEERGDMFLARKALLAEAQRLLGADPNMLDEALDWMIGGGDLISQSVGETDAIFLPYLAKMEDYIAKRLLRLREAPAYQTWDLASIEDELHLELSDQQRDAVLSALNAGLLIITGGPGTGKTTIIRFIAHAFSEAGYSLSLAAPTGRAAKCMSEATGFDASTIHRLLEYIPGEGFIRNLENPLLCDMLIVDEMSMVDAPLMYALLKATTAGTRLILVGDSDQLPPVGCGSVLLDALRSNLIPTCKLTEIFRQAQQSRIVRNAHLVNHGRMPILAPDHSDFLFEEISAPDRIVRRLTELVKDQRDRLQTDEPLMDVQVLVPMKTGPLGVVALNQHLQAVLNPPAHTKQEHSYGETLFREGYKIMQIKNDYKIEWRKREKNGSYTEGLGVFNGDLGTLVALDNDLRTGTVAFDDGRICTYEYTKFDELDLAYCITIHKSQGSEFKTVLLPLAGGPPMLLTRNLLYTAITRAKKLVYCIGRSDTISRMVYNAQKNERNTSLAVRLVEYEKLS
ncbi:MAG: ATP-dependent RecD-like DNA helicase [Clostridia bacterium]|nr:ATP-dependent RecD-like DNA helicase [Clostridia bacterium]